MKMESDRPVITDGIVQILLSDPGQVTVYFFLFILAAPHGMWYLSSLTRDRTHAPYIGSMEL